MSIDFDLFTSSLIQPRKLLKKFEAENEKATVTLNMGNQLNLICRNVKFTFFQFEFPIKHPISLDDVISMPTLLDLAAMKAYALGRRTKWKDYVDLYFLLKHHFNFQK